MFAGGWLGRPQPPPSPTVAVSVDPEIFKAAVAMHIRRIYGQRPAGLAYWRAVHDGSGAPVGQRRWLWMLVCEALRMPFHLTGRGNRMRFYVPALYEERARRELGEVAAEGGARKVMAAMPAYDNAQYAALLFVALMIWHGLRMRWWGNGPFLGLWPEAWSGIGALDVYRVAFMGQWERAFTALTLHAGSEHLFSNIVFGLPVLILLFRRIGTGWGLWLTIFGGALGNLVNVGWRIWTHEPATVSLGFSTALFAAVGALSALMAVGDLRAPRPEAWRRRWRKSAVYVAAGAALLALLGGGDSEALPQGGRTDYVAHVTGWFAGGALGGLVGWLVPQQQGQVPRSGRMAGLLALAALVLAWLVAGWR